MADPIVGSVLLSFFLITFVLTVVSFTVNDTRDAKTRTWRIANVAILVGATNALLSSTQAASGQLWITNLLIIVTAISASYASLLASKRKPALWFYAILLFLLLGTFLYYLFAVNDVLRRIVITSVCALLLAAYTAIEVGAAFRQRSNRYYLILAGVFAVAACGYFYLAWFAATAAGLSESEARTAANWLGLSINLFLFVSWNIIFYILTINDYQQQLRESDERFRLVVENSPNPILLWDQTGALTYVSPGVEAMFGYDQQEMIAGVAGVIAAAEQLDEADRTPERLVAAGVSQQLVAESWLQAIDTIKRCGAQPGLKIQAETYLPTPMGSQHTLVITSQAYARTASEYEVVSVAHDITELRDMQRRLQKINAELEQQVADRTADLQATVQELQVTTDELRRADAGKDAFLAMVSHELRTPLTAILSMSELLESQVRGPLNPDQVRYVAAVHKGGQRLLATVNHILLYTSLLASDFEIEYEACRLVELCTIAVRSVKARAGYKQQCIMQKIAPADLVIKSYAQGIVQMLRILLDNAVKFTPEGGLIEVSVTQGEPAAAAPTMVHLTVRDNGIGMDEAQQAALFRAFTQGDLTLARRYEGLGLGLAYAHELSKRLGGSVAVDSQLGEGSCFTITLPVAPRAPQPLSKRRMVDRGIKQRMGEWHVG